MPCLQITFGCFDLKAGLTLLRGGLLHFNAVPPRITLSGLEYDAQDLELPLGCQGGSNRILEEEFVVELDGGPVFLTQMDKNTL